jgi:AraC family transcriptional regulator, regulatory protein of adaptative response / DNA-3-methyladenine glycosylase II
MTRNETFYKAMLARDYRFDGKFFVGVKTTGIFCRPICPAKPKFENVDFFPDAISAERAGYRPCLRCRPEAAPQSPAWQGKSATVQRALRFIAANELFTMNEDKFAARLGVTSRHLRRLFAEEIGQTPKQISDNNRLNFARKLIVETAIPVTEVAHSSGFSSLRRFNDAFKNRFSKSPSELRKTKAESGQPYFELSLPYRPPYNWENLLAYYRSHGIPGVETVTEKTYARVFKLEKSVGAFEIRNFGEKSQLLVKIYLEDTKLLLPIVQRIRHMFDLDSDPLLVANAFQPVKTLAALHKKYSGLRLPRGWEPFEVVVKTILGQLVSIPFASVLTGQLVMSYGEEVVDPMTGTKTFLFPTPKDLANAKMSEVKTTTARKLAIREFSKRVLSKQIDISETQDPTAFRQALLEIPGIGAWTAEYISLRAIGDTDAFPHTDLILKRALEKHPEMDVDLVKPWRSYAAIYLWKEYAKLLSKQKVKKEKTNETRL